RKSLFLAGGITNCPDWQALVISHLWKEELTVFNPRRTKFPMGDTSAAPEQIKWEFDCLRKADAILFWFPKETLCPIVLYELGANAMTSKTLFVGIHPEYERKLDIEVQLKLVRPDVEIVYDLKILCQKIEQWIQ
ncbi:MAG: nucleoside 2-deoxyribosyltransferase domain-containing protein, partial [Bacteroidota bacterium]